MSAIVVHAKSLSLAALSSSGAGTQSLSLPSRFPSGETPRSASAAGGGNTFVWGSGPTVWEYDGRGRRVGELSAGAGVDAVAGFERGVAVASGREVVLFRRNGSGTARWAKADTIDVGAKVECMDAGAGVLAVCTADGVAAYALESGVRLDMPRVALDEIPSVVRVLASAMPAILVPSRAGLARVSLAGASDDIALPLPRVADIGVRGGRAVIAGGSMLAFLHDDGGHDLVDLESELSARGERADLAGVAWVNAHAVAAYTTSGAVVLVDAETHTTTPISLTSPALGIHAVAVGQTTTRRAVSERPALAETNTNAAQRRSKEVGFDKRAVSAPTAHAESVIASPRPAPRARDWPRQISGAQIDPPSAVSTARFRPASDTFTPSTIAPTPATLRGGVPAVAGLRDVPEDEGEGGLETEGMALASGSGSAHAPGASLEVEALRREIANLQLDMLRMGRGLKNEIRATVAPLVDELRASRDTIAAQAAEIERLRRGY